MARTYGSTTWFITVFSMFFVRGILNSSWTSRGPQVREALGINVADMGIIAAIFAAGAVIGVVGATPLIVRTGSRLLAVAMYITMPISLTGAGLAVVGHSYLGVTVSLFFFGLAFGSADFVSSIEASELDRSSSKSRLPALHGGYSLGVMTGAVLTSILIVLDVSLEIQLWVLAALAGVWAVYRVSGLPAHHGKHPDHEITGKPVLVTFTPAGRKRTLQISAIGFIFVFVEGSASVFIPLALTEAGRTPGQAAIAYTVYSVGMAVTRLVGGYIVDRIGRRAVVVYSAIVCGVGVVLFSLAPLAPLEYIGGLLWGLGGSLSIAMCVSAAADNKRTATKAQGTLWTWVYSANLAVGPVFGGVSLLIGVFASFAVPILLLLGAAALSPVMRRDPELEPIPA